MIWDAPTSGHPLGILSGLLQIGVIVFAVLLGLVFRRDEKKAEQQRKAVEIDLSEVPDWRDV